MKRVRVLRNDMPVSGRLEGTSILLDDGNIITEVDARYLPPIEPTKILATHLSYRSRAREFGIQLLPAVPCGRTSREVPRAHDCAHAQ